MEQKEEIKIKFARHLIELDETYAVQQGRKASLRSLAARSGLEYSHVQRISKGKVDLSLTTIFALAHGLEVSPKQLLDF